MDMTQRLRILNGQFDPLTLPQTVDTVFSRLQTGQRGWLCTVNVAILMMMRADPRLQSFADRASIAVADGQPLVWAAPWFGGRLPERVTGVDLVDAICERAALEGKKVFLLGATDDIVTKVATRLRERNPALNLAFSNGYFSKDDASARADQVGQSGADILFVAMGVPRQEQFIEEHWERLGVGMAIGVGGSFDVLAGLRARAPTWMQNMGMEWLFRLLQEPRRLFSRYLTTNSQFLWLVLRALTTRGSAKNGPN
jgi:N-acetylglucosaminyldiphosphoundecaprenol N-acetyl-beta-D-mannosaminyltransferase